MLEKQETLETSIAKKREELAGISKQAEDSMEQLQQFEVEIQNLKREKDEMLAKEANADAQIKIQETLSSLSVDADIQALANVRESIEKKASQKPKSVLNLQTIIWIVNSPIYVRKERNLEQGLSLKPLDRLVWLRSQAQSAQASEAQTSSSNDTPPPPSSGNSGGKTI